jgi:hypothetical protein
MQLIDQLTLKWQQAKQREFEARDERVGIEEQILALYPAREEGSSTVETDLGTKIRLTGKLTYKVDVIALHSMTIDWPEDVRPVRMKMEVDETKLKAIRQESPTMWAKIAPAVTTKPAKTGVAIEFKEQ